MWHDTSPLYKTSPNLGDMDNIYVSSIMGRGCGMILTCCMRNHLAWGIWVMINV